MATDSLHRVIKPCGHSSARIFDRIFFILSGNKDNYKVWTEFEFGADRTKGCGVSERKIPIDLKLVKCCGHSSEFIFHWIFFILAGNKHIYKTLNEFEFLPDSTTDFGVICPWAQKSTYYLVATLAPSFLIGSSSFFRVSRKTIKFGQNSNFGQIGPRAVKLAALERLENAHRLITGGIL